MSIVDGVRGNITGIAKNHVRVQNPIELFQDCRVCLCGHADIDLCRKPSSLQIDRRKYASRKLRHLEREVEESSLKHDDVFVGREGNDLRVDDSSTVLNRGGR